MRYSSLSPSPDLAPSPALPSSYNLPPPPLLLLLPGEGLATERQVAVVRALLPIEWFARSHFSLREAGKHRRLGSRF